MRILILGKNGQLGRCLSPCLATLGDVVAYGSNEVDFREPRLLRELVREVFPDLIVNSAAYTAVDQAEADVEAAMAINAVAPGVLAEEAERIGAGLVHYSSDYVFDGASNRRYTEDDIPNPLSVYGQSKLQGDQAIQDTNAGHLILRTSWVYGSFRDNFFVTVLRLARECTEIRMVDDQVVAPAWVQWVVDTTVTILQGIDPALPHPAARYLRDRGGLYHLTAAGQTTPFGFAREILSQDPWRTDHTVRAVHRIRLEDYRAAARRPLFSLLDSTRVQEAFGVHLEDWEVQLRSCWSALTPADAATFRDPGIGL